jgi:hypothetical protein
MASGPLHDPFRNINVAALSEDHRVVKASLFHLRLTKLYNGYQYATLLRRQIVTSRCWTLATTWIALTSLADRGTFFLGDANKLVIV